MATLKFPCARCGKVTERPAGHVNRSRAIGAPLYCGKKCFGLSRRKGKTKAQKRAEKKAYDADYRAKNLTRIKAKKRAYHLRTYDPAEARIERKKRSKYHAEYCRAPEYRRWKSEYDRKRRDSAYGAFAEVARLTIELNREIKERSTNHEIRWQNQTSNKAQFRRRKTSKEPERAMKLNVLDLFSAIGGHAIGLHDAGGFNTIAFCESVEQRRRLLQHHFHGVPIYSDVREVSAQRLLDDGNTISVQVVIGGPPCQRTSVAAAIHGKRTGESLWPEMLRICDDFRPQWVVVEQPPGNVAWEAEVTSGLAQFGYHSARAEFSARDLGAPHIRRRVFILANACLARLSLAWQAIPQEIDRIARAAAAGNPWHAGPPRGLRVANGVSGWLDRDAAVEAIGESNPPAMATVIGRAIMSAERQ